MNFSTLQAHEDGVQTYAAMDAIEKNFPNAMKGKDVEAKTFETLKDLGFEKANTLYADSSCPDEINHNGTDITTHYVNRYGEMFTLSGLGGLPFTG